MRTFFTTGLLLAVITPAVAQDATPNLKGTWSGAFKSVVFGNNSHHPGTQAVTDPPRTRDVRFTYEVEGQEGRLIWGKSWSSPDTKEPFAMALSPDNKTLFGVDTDGHYQLTILSPDRIDLCYAHTALGPTKSMVASCGVMERAKP